MIIMTGIIPPPTPKLIEFKDLLKTWHMFLLISPGNKSSTGPSHRRVSLYQEDPSRYKMRFWHLWIQKLFNQRDNGTGRWIFDHDYHVRNNSSSSYDITCILWLLDVHLGWMVIQYLVKFPQFVGYYADLVLFLRRPPYLINDVIID